MTEWQQYVYKSVQVFMYLCYYNYTKTVKKIEKNIPSIMDLMIIDFEIMLISTWNIFPVMHCSWHFTIYIVKQQKN